MVKGWSVYSHINNIKKTAIKYIFKQHLDNISATDFLLKINVLRHCVLLYTYPLIWYYAFMMMTGQ